MRRYNEGVLKMELKISSMGESVIEVTIGAILKPSGSFVREGEEILELETDKVNQVLSAPSSGLLTLKVQTGQKAKIGEVIGEIQEDNQPPPIAKEEKVMVSKPSLEVVPPSTFPKVRQSIDESLQKEEKKEEMITPSVISSKGQKREKMTKLRKVIAQRLVKVKNETAMLTTFNEVDMSAIITLREKEQDSFTKRHGVRLGFMSFFIKAVVSALEEYPMIGAEIDGDEIVHFDKIHISVAVSTDRGLVVPVIRDAQALSFAEIEKRLKEFAEKAREGTLSVDAMQGGNFTITNGGVFGSLLSTPIINPPQSAILGMHAIVKRPVAIDDQVVIRPMMYLALSYDHRIVDGKEAIGFLVHVKKILEEPTRLLLD